MVKIGERLVSLDVFRGITMACMVLVENPGNWSIYHPLRHARWGMMGEVPGVPVHETITPTDLIMPFFLLIIGISLVFSLEQYKKQGGSQGALIRKISVRAIKLYVLGLFFYAYPSILEAIFYDGTIHLQAMGVLQRIAIVYFAASILYLKLSRRSIVWLSGITLVVYWLVLSFVPEPANGQTLLYRQWFTEGNIPTNIVAWVDAQILGFEDPAGLLSSFTAIVTGLIGVLVGIKLKVDEDPYKKTVEMMMAGFALLAVGYLWGTFFPVIKDMWTSSYTLVAGGYGLLAFSVVYWLVDIRGSRSWTPPSVAYGVNCISVYVLSHMMSATFWTLRSTRGEETIKVQDWINETLFESWLSPMNASMAYALSVVVIWFIPLWYLYKKKVYIKV